MMFAIVMNGERWNISARRLLASAAVGVGAVAGKMRVIALDKSLAWWFSKPVCWHRTLAIFWRWTALPVDVMAADFQRRPSAICIARVIPAAISIIAVLSDMDDRANPRQR